MGLVLQVEEINGELPPPALRLPPGLDCMHHRVISQPCSVTEGGGAVPASWLVPVLRSLYPWEQAALS